MTDSDIGLEQAWSELCRDLGTGDDRRGAVWRDIVAAYGEPQRHYHTLSHITAVVANAERLRDRFEDASAALLALFFHDIVYDPARHDNEARSADRLRDAFGDVASIDRACAHVLATQHHDAHADPDTNLVLDIDMAILGAPWADYLTYAEGVYREYLPVYGDEAYAKGRAELFLKPTLQRKRLFLTADFAHLEDQAKRNLRVELDLWAKGGFAPREKPPI